MPKRPLYWLGLLLGGFGAFALRRFKPRPTTSPTDFLFGLTGDAVIVCDCSGAVVRANPAAYALFGPQCTGLTSLRYPTGQPVPPGQLPLTRPQTDAEYHQTDPGGRVRTLCVSSRSLPGGGRAAVFRDVTLLRDAEARERARLVEAAALHRLGMRLGKLGTAEAIAAAVVEEAYALLLGLPGVRVHLYSYSRAAQTITRQASAPEERAKPSQNQPTPHTFPFDASDPALWRLYVARRPVSADGLLTLPLLSVGRTIGHLAVSSTDPDAFAAPERCTALETLAALAALAVAVPLSAEFAGRMARQAEVLGEISRAIADGLAPDRLADLIMRSVRRLTSAEACTVSMMVEGTLVALGTAYADDLLSPERTPPDAKALHGKAVQKAWRTQKAVAQAGPTPSVWRTLAGNGGRHTILALPLNQKRGVLTVYTSDDAPIPEAQLKFLEIAALLLSVGLTNVPRDNPGV